MATVAGFSICFVSRSRIKQITMAADEDAIEQLIVARFGELRVLSRAPLDAKALEIMKLKPGEWLEWVPLAK